jgi:hypothetical protein
MHMMHVGFFFSLFFSTIDGQTSVCVMGMDPFVTFLIRVSFAQIDLVGLPLLYMRYFYKRWVKAPFIYNIG